METASLLAERRSDLGSRASRALRARGRLPVVIYGHGELPEHVSLDFHDVEVALAHGARTLELKEGRKTTQYLIKEVQHDHLDALPIHLDLARVDLDERVTVRVSIELRGTPKGVSEGGVLDQVLPEIEVECRVADIPDTLHPLVTELGLGDSLLVGDLELPAGVSAVTDSRERVATLRAVLEEAPVEEVVEGEEKTEEPERIGRVRPEEETKES